MARPQKKGLDYFPMDVDAFDSDEFKLIKAEFGSDGLLIVMRLYCKIYKTNGYYYEWGDDQCLLFAVGAGVVPTFVQEVLGGCFRRSIFDKRVFEMFGTLTSAGIQRRYFRAIDDRKLSNIEIKHEILLLSDQENDDFFGKSSKNKSFINPSKSMINSNKSMINSEQNQNRGKPIVNHGLTDINHGLTRVNHGFSTQRKEYNNTTTHTNTRAEANDFFEKNEEIEIETVSKKNNSDEMKQKLLDAGWLEQVCVGQSIEMDEFKPFVENYVSMKILIGDFESYKITQHKRFVISDFNKKKSDEMKKAQNTSTATRQVPPQRESVLEHNKRVFEELRGV